MNTKRLWRTTMTEVEEINGESYAEEEKQRVDV